MAIYLGDPAPRMAMWSRQDPVSPFWGVGAVQDRRERAEPDGLNGASLPHRVNFKRIAR